MPNQDGISDSLIVTTYMSTDADSIIIDQDSTQFVMTVAAIVSDDYNIYSMSNNVALGTGQTDYSYRVMTTVDLAKTLVMTFRGLTLNAGTICRRKIVTGSVVSYVNYAASVSGNAVTIDLTASTITAGTTGEVVCTSLINLPSVSTYSTITQLLHGRHPGQRLDGGPRHEYDSDGIVRVTASSASRHVRLQHTERRQYRLALACSV